MPGSARCQMQGEDGSQLETVNGDDGVSKEKRRGPAHKDVTTTRL